MMDFALLSKFLEEKIFRPVQLVVLEGQQLGLDYPAVKNKIS